MRKATQKRKIKKRIYQYYINVDTGKLVMTSYRFRNTSILFDCKLQLRYSKNHENNIYLF